MKLRLLVFTLFMCVFTSISFAQYETEEYEAPKETDRGKSIELKNKLCPVTLEKITTADTYTYTYEGKAYRFSSARAIEEFKKDPEKYLKEWEKKERFYKINIVYD